MANVNMPYPTFGGEAPHGRGTSSRATPRHGPTELGWSVRALHQGSRRYVCRSRSTGGIEPALPTGRSATAGTVVRRA